MVFFPELVKQQIDRKVLVFHRIGNNLSYLKQQLFKTHSRFYPGSQRQHRINKFAVYSFLAVDG
ncbi:hypothetical protein PALA104618_16875 [Paenibacillus larvae]